MLSRRNLRIKAFQAIYAATTRELTDPKEVLREFDDNIKHFVWMYQFLLQLPEYFNSYLISEKDIELEKYFPDKERIRTFSSFDNNPIVKILEQDDILSKECKHSPYQWKNNGELLMKIFKNIHTQEFFIDFLVFDNPDKQQSFEFLMAFYGYLFESEEGFTDEISGIYIDLDNDLGIFYRMIKKTLETILEKNKVILIDSYINREDDYGFAKELITKSILNAKMYEDYMLKVTKNWEADRIAKADIILMRMAITEFLYLPNIPIKVTINEYLDLAKDFSTPKSHIFINGILDKIKNNLKEEGRIIKEGRGLRDN